MSSSTRSLTAIANNHDFDTSFTNEYDADQTAANLLTPTSGKSLQIAGYYVTTEATTGFLRLSIDSNTLGTFFASSGNSVVSYIPIYAKGLRNSSIKITSTFGVDKNYFILVNYKEVP